MQNVSTFVLERKFVFIVFILGVVTIIGASIVTFVNQLNYFTADNKGRII